MKPMIEFRIKELKYFFDNFLKYSGINNPCADDYEKLCFYFDAFIFCLVSCAETDDDNISELIKKIEPFIFIKALRNISAHYGPPHIISNGRGSPFFNRVINETFTAKDNKIELKLNIASSVKEIDRVNKKYMEKYNRKRGNETYLQAIVYLGSLCGQTVFIHEIFQSVLEDIISLQER